MQSRERRKKIDLKLMMVLILYSVAARMPLLIITQRCTRLSSSTLSSSASFTHLTRSLMQSSHTTLPNTNTNSQQHSFFL